MAIGDDLTAFADSRFPKLTPTDGNVTSIDDEYYNCFAWAANDTNNRWEPGHVWFPKSHAVTLDTLSECYRYVGFELTENGDFEEGFEKIAIYVKDDGEAAHAARLLPNGKWTSKLGELEDIVHDDLTCIECETYGSVKAFMKRKEGDTKAWLEKALETSRKSSKTSKN